MLEKKKLSLDHAIFWPSFIIISVVCALIVMNPEKANEVSNAALAWCTNKLDGLLNGM
jgi:L-carnitine/gamma-butyrobetaine antiporter